MNVNRVPLGGLASIIIPCWNQLEFTRQCVRALARHTRPAWELIIIDNGSTDGTREYLAGLQDALPVPVTVIANATNHGFPAAINQGLDEARGEHLVLLNNDVVVTDGWLDQLVALTEVQIREGEPELTQMADHDAPDVSSARHPPPAATAGRPSRIWGRVGGRRRIPARAEPRPPMIGSDDAGDDASFREAEPCGEPGRIPARTEARPPSARNVGLAGPMSNYAAPPQLVDGVPYHDMNGMHAFAQSWRDEHLGRWFTVPKLSGFCLLMKREVYEKIGGLDERFGLGFFDDDDLAERARRAGFELAVAHDLFVHHFGSRTFAGNGIDAEGLLDDNARRFAAKWGLSGTNGRRVALRPFSAATRNGDRIGRDDRPQMAQMDADEKQMMKSKPLMPSDLSANGRSAPQSIPNPFRSSDLRRSAPSADKNRRLSISADSAAKRVSLTMIVKNEESNLSSCLSSVDGLFDELVIVDTGSTDRTIEIARSFGARVFDFPWVDDFAAARNAALARATGEFALWLDADDVVEPAEAGKVRSLLADLGNRADAGYVVRCACDPSPDGTGGDTVVDHIRLFPVREGLRWTYRVHEQILPALNRFKIPVEWTDIVVRHTGYVDQALRGRKLDRDVRILRAELAERPDDPFILFNLGAIEVERKDWPAALGHLERSLELSAPTDSIVRKLYAQIARVHQMRGDSQAALGTCARGLELEPENAELWFRKAVVHRHRGESSAAESCWRRLLTLKRPNKFCSMDQGIFGHLTRRNLAALAAERGDHAEAHSLWQAVLAECPGDKEALAKIKHQV